MTHATGDPKRLPAPVRGTASEWTVRCGNQATSWDWSLGVPDPRSLEPVRRPTSSEKHRHVPVRAHSTTTGGVLLVESGLEHELVLGLDRDPAVVWLVPQPFRLRYVEQGVSRRRTHTPDLLSLDDRDTVTIWDARPPAKQDEKFGAASKITAKACDDIGWRYKVFSGHPPVRAANLRWLSAYRHVQPWYEAAAEELGQICRRPKPCVADVLAAEHGAGHLLSALWHYCWSGAIEVDLDLPLTRHSAISCVTLND